VTLTTPLLGVVCHIWGRIWYILPVCKIWWFYIKPFQIYHWGPQNLKQVTGRLTMPLLRDICQQYVGIWYSLPMYKIWPL